MSYATDIIKVLSKLGTNGPVNPDSKHNRGRLLGEAFLWDTVYKYAEKRREGAWDALKKNEVVVTEGLDPGEHSPADSPNFICYAKVSQPVKRFSADTLATALKKKYKIAEPIAKEMIEAAKVPTTSTVSLKVVERV